MYQFYFILYYIKPEDHEVISCGLIIREDVAFPILIFFGQVEIIYMKKKPHTLTGKTTKWLVSFYLLLYIYREKKMVIVINNQ